MILSGMGKDEYPWKLTPQKDMTAYELAMMLARSGGFNANDCFYSQLPPETQRHYSRNDGD